MKLTLSRGFLVATCLTLLAQTAFSQAPVTNLSSLYAPADEWTDASTLEWIPEQQVTMRNIYVPQSAAEWTYNHNPGIVEFNGTLFLGWHQGWKSEDNETQFRVAYAVSNDGGLSWSGMRIAVPDPDGTGPGGRFFNGFWVRGGELYLLSDTRSLVGGGESIQLYHWNASTVAFDYVAEIISGTWCSHGHNVLPIADGRYVIPIHNLVSGEKAFLIGGVSSETNFVKHTIWPGPKRFSEHSYYQLPDGNLMFYFREYSTVKRLYRAVISPDGTGLQGPVVTDCPDDPSRQHASRWPGGKYYIVGNLDAARSAGSEWVTLTNPAPCQVGSWVRLTARADYVLQTWSLYLDGTNVAANLGFAMPQQRAICFSAEGPTSVVDGLTVGYAVPAGITIPANLYESSSGGALFMIR